MTSLRVALVGRVLVVVCCGAVIGQLVDVACAGVVPSWLVATCIAGTAYTGVKSLIHVYDLSAELIAHRG